MDASIRLRGVTALAGMAAVSSLAALAPATFATGTAHKCSNIVVSIARETEGVKQTFKAGAKTISTKGVSCAAADKFIKLAYGNTSTVTPEHYKCVSGHFKAAVGYMPTVCTHGSARIQYGAQGG